MKASEEQHTEMTYVKDVKNAVDTLRRGGIILYPTDTVWGIGCDASNLDAVSRVYALKQRLESKSMLVLMQNTAMVERYVDNAPDIAFSLMEEAVEPLTVIFDKAIGLAANLTGEDGSIGIRIPDDKFCQDLLFGFRRPIVSTSVNISGQPAARFYDEIPQQLLDCADYVVMHRRDDKSIRKPSSIIKISNSGVFKIIRK